MTFTYQRFTAVLLLLLLLLIYGSLFLSSIYYCLRVFWVCRRENVGAWIRATNEQTLNFLLLVDVDFSASLRG